MAKKHICLQCGNETFVTTAHVVQDWKVDAYGNFIEDLGTTETVAPPDDGNIWTCTACGAEAVVMDECNTEICYMCRDSGNYKSYEHIILPGTIGQSQKDRILNSLMDREYFIPEMVGIEAKRNWPYDPDVDTPYWELHAADIHVTKMSATTTRTIEDLVRAFEVCRDKWRDYIPGKWGGELA